MSLNNPPTQSQWQSNVASITKFGSAGRNVAHAVAVDAQNRTVVVGEFDSSVQVGRYRLSSPYPAAFVVQSTPDNHIRWAVQCALTPRHKTDASTSAAALAVALVSNDGDVVVGGSFSASSITFTGSDGAEAQLFTLASDSAAFLVRIDAEGRIVWLRGPVVSELMYVTSLAASVDSGDVFVGGFFQGVVDFVGVPAALPYSEHVQGWLAKFSSTGQLTWVMSLLGAGRNVIADVAYAPESSQLAVVGSFQADCAVSTMAANGSLAFALTLNGTASRSVFLSAVDDASGALLWTNAIVDQDPNAPAVTCDDHHYVKHAPQSGDLYAVGCFSGALNFSTAPDGDAVTLDSGSPYNSIYVAKYASNGSLVWTQALLGDNISDYPFSAAVIQQPYIEAGDLLDEPVALNEGLLVSAFVQGGWRPLASANCANVAPIVPADAAYGALYATAIDQTGCLAWMSLVAFGRAQPAGMVPLAQRATFALYGTFTGSVQFGDKTITSVQHSADVFVCFFSLEPAATPELEDFSRDLWQYSVIGAFACLFLLAFTCIGAMYWPSAKEAADRSVPLAARADEASAENSDDDL